MLVFFFLFCTVFSLIGNLRKRKIYDAACDYRRRWTRYKLPVPLQTVVQLRGMYRAEAECVSVSEGGLCLFAVASLPIGGLIDILIPHPSDLSPIRLRGSIRNCSMYLYGVELLSESALASTDVARICNVTAS
jgi:hypothetical protein